MDTLTAATGGASVILIIGISLIPFIILCVVAYRLKIIAINTYRNTKTPGANYYAEALSFEKVGNATEAKRNYLLAYWAMTNTRYKKFKFMGKWVNISEIEAKCNS